MVSTLVLIIWQLAVLMDILNATRLLKRKDTVFFILAFILERSHYVQF